MISKQEFGFQMARLAAAYRQDVTQATTAVYYEVLGAFEQEHLERAVTWTLAHAPFLPAPSALLERVKHERTQRPILAPASVRALPPAATPALEPAPEWVTEGEPVNVKAIVAELLPKLTASEGRVKGMRPARRDAAGDPENSAHLTYERGTAEDMAWRRERAQQELRRLEAYCAEQGIDWKTGKPCQPVHLPG